MDRRAVAAAGLLSETDGGVAIIVVSAGGPGTSKHRPAIIEAAAGPESRYSMVSYRPRLDGLPEMGLVGNSCRRSRA